MKVDFAIGDFVVCVINLDDDSEEWGGTISCLEDAYWLVLENAKERYSGRSTALIHIRTSRVVYICLGAKSQ
jgi:small nuclear ribonucleoprotein (snRNP)-like protein